MLSITLSFIKFQFLFHKLVEVTPIVTRHYTLILPHLSATRRNYLLNVRLLHGQQPAPPTGMQLNRLMTTSTAFAAKRANLWIVS